MHSIHRFHRSSRRVRRPGPPSRGLFFETRRRNPSSLFTLVLFLLAASWFLAAPVGAATVFTHVADESDTFLHATRLDHPSINGDPNAPVVIAQVYDPEGDISGIVNPHFVGLRYDAGSWFVENQDFGLMPIGAAFRILVADPSESFHVHEVTDSGAGYVSELDHPDLNGKPEARIFLTRNNTPGGSAAPRMDSAVRITYNGSRWFLLSFEGAGVVDFPIGAAFNVYVAPSTASTTVHVTTSETLASTAEFSRIDLPLANGHPDTALFFTLLEPAVAHVTTPSPLGGLYDLFDARWAVFPEDGSLLSEDMYFHVLAEPLPIFADGFESGDASRWSG